MSCNIRHACQTGAAMVYHHCGQCMQHLDSYLVGGYPASDWWCNRCAEAESLLGDEDYPRQFPKKDTP